MKMALAFRERAVPPMTATLLGSVDKSRSGIAAGVLNSTRQTGSVLGVALFGSLIGAAHAFLFGAKVALIISAVLLVGAASRSAGGPGNSRHEAENTKRLPTAVGVTT